MTEATELPSVPNDRRRDDAERKPTAAQNDLIDYLRSRGVDAFAAAHRVIDLGMTREDADWNDRLGRPIQFLETLDRPAEAQRRQDWTDTHPNG